MYSIPKYTTDAFGYRNVEVIDYYSRSKAESLELVAAYAKRIEDKGDELFNSSNGCLAIVKFDQDGQIYVHTNRVNYWYKLNYDMPSRKYNGTDTCESEYYS